MLSNRFLMTTLALAVALVSFDATRAQARRTNLARSLGEPGCCAPEPVCCPEPCIKYRYCRKHCHACEPTQTVVLKVTDPCTCCEVDVPVCLPACCKGDPSVCTGKGFLCRDTVEYEWCCGVYVRVAFKKCGDLVVTVKG